jgi:very-short-patch-repair endonuclease
LLAGGEGAVLSHRSAAEAWDLRADNRSRVELTAVRHTGRDQPSLSVHRCHLTPGDVTRHRGVLLTTPARTLLDLADVVSRRELVRAVERSEVLRLFDGAAIADLLTRSNGRRGVGVLRAVVAEFDEGHLATRSELERRALELLRARGLPAPAVNARVGRCEVDLLWRGRRVVVELDGFAYHRSAAAFERDRRRDADLQARGYRVLRVTWRQLTGDPDWVAARLSALLAPGVSNQPR